MEPLLPSLEKYYIKSIKQLLYISAASFFIGIWMGLMTTETRMQIGYDQTDNGTYLQATMYLSLLHGHIFMMGGVMPMIMCVMLVFGKLIGGNNIPKKFLSKLIFLYTLGMVSSLVLLLAKGIRIFNLTKQELPSPDFIVIDNTIMGSVIVKLLVYSFSHIVLTAGICIFMYLFCYSIKSV